MDRSQEEQWALALKKARQGIRQQSRIPLADRRARLDTDLVAAKLALKHAVQERKQTQAKECLQHLIEIRAKQTALTLEAWQTEYGKLSDKIIRLETERYTRDCVKLIHAVERYFFV